MPLLMDQIAGAAALVRSSPQKKARLDLMMQCFEIVEDLLDGAPRFLLDAAATRTAVEINLGRPKVILEAMQNLRIPYERLWFEWEDSERQRMRQRWEEIGYVDRFLEVAPMPGRMGALVDVAPGGRSGTLTWAWTTPDPQNPSKERFPNIGSIETHFDLDRMFHLSEDRIDGLNQGNLAMAWMGNPVQKEALFDIWRHCEFYPSEWGRHFLKLDPNGMMTRLAYRDVVGEWIMAVSILLLLTASRPVVDYTAVSRAKLNKARAKRRDVPLLDHTVVSLHLSGREAREAPRQPLGYLRKSPRVHMVSSYLARRGDKHWIVAPYFRGKGELISRHVNVRG